MISGRVWRFGDDISTDLIAPGRLFHLRTNLPELAKHVLEDADPDFPKNVRPGDIIVAGRNFGLGSSREHAPLIIKMSGISAVLAKSFARIFYRNAINIGLPLLEVDTDHIQDGIVLDIDLNKGIVTDKEKTFTLSAIPIPHFMIRILEEGGLVPYIKKYGDFCLD
ncbi:3-isopropylmalate dehydratase small subunit [bacterium]|nr:3-isopropylmalate dehydratase small subunit [bacterium]